MMPWITYVTIVHRYRLQDQNMHFTEMLFRTKKGGATPCPVKQLLSGVLPIWQPMRRPPTASDTLPPQNNNHPTTLHHVKNI